MVLMWFVVSQIVSGVSSFFTKTKPVPLDNSGSPLVSTKIFQNMMLDDQKYNVAAWVSFKRTFESAKKAESEPHWQEDLTYNWDEQNYKALNLSIPVKQTLLSNKTLYLHVEMTAENAFYNSKPVAYLEDL
jgi:hypothetical protein